MYIVIAIIAFGLLIGLHELGHFIAAKACGVKVNEFSIGMGPTILKKQGKETLYALRLLPIGGFCAMEGEDDATGDPRAFVAQNHIKRIVILIAGPFMNLLVGFIVVLLIFCNSSYYAGTTIQELADGFPTDGPQTLMEGDTLYSIDGERLYYMSDFSTFMLRSDGDVDIVVIRNGEKVQLKDYELTKRAYVDENGIESLRYGVSFNLIKANAWENFKYSCYMTGNFVRMIRLSLSDLFSGSVGIKDLSGPVGIVSIMNDVGNESESTSDALINIAYLCAFVAVNLAVMNMLPIPALDGGRVFFLVITWILESITRKKINPKYEGYIHTVGLVLLMGLMVVVMFNDIVNLFRG